MRRTTMLIDEKLMHSCLKITGIRTRRALVDRALRELLRREKQAKILELMGKVTWEGDLTKMRSTR